MIILKKGGGRRKRNPCPMCLCLFYEKVKYKRNTCPTFLLGFKKGKNAQNE
jgi:hypothetical protein